MGRKGDCVDSFNHRSEPVEAIGLHVDLGLLTRDERGDHFTGFRPHRHTRVHDRKRRLDLGIPALCRGKGNTESGVDGRGPIHSSVSSTFKSGNISFASFANTLARRWSGVASTPANSAVPAQRTPAFIKLATNFDLTFMIDERAVRRDLQTPGGNHVRPQARLLHQRSLKSFPDQMPTCEHHSLGMNSPAIRLHGPRAVRCRLQPSGYCTGVHAHFCALSSTLPMRPGSRARACCLINTVAS